MINISITVFGKSSNIEAVYVRCLKGNEVDTKSSESIKEFVIDFLCGDAIERYTTKEFSPFGKHASFTYKDEDVINTILVTWEHTQS